MKTLLKYVLQVVSKRLKKGVAHAYRVICLADKSLTVGSLISPERLAWRANISV